MRWCRLAAASAIIIGDRQTGKTAVAVDTIINQKGKDHLHLRGRGQKASTIATWSQARGIGAMAYTIVVAASAPTRRRRNTSPVLGCTMGEYFRDRGQDALIIYDDLTSRRGRTARSRCCCAARRAEAYPGDVFYSTAACSSAPRA
jgi:F-type H+-transporting ATPase subunit alpha